MSDRQITMTETSAIDELMALRASEPLSKGELSITGSDPFYPTPFRAGETVASVLGAIGVAANDIWEMRNGRRQNISVDRAMAAASVRTGDYTRVKGDDGAFHTMPVPPTFSHMLSVTQPWRTKDDRYYLPHFNLPHLRERVLSVLNCEDTVQAVSDAVAQWTADDLEEAIAAARACGGKIRTQAEWLTHPQGRFLAGRPLVAVDRVGPSQPEPFAPAERPLSGIRVLDLTRILAGPMASRALAEQGADVLMVTAEHLPQIADHVRDTSHGKRSCFLDLRSSDGKARLMELVKEADVFVNGYRPGQLQKFGFGLDDLMRIRPGIVVASVSCFGSGGPFADRAGWEQVAQSVSGVCETNGRLTGAPKPKLLTAPVCDYTTGYLAAFGVLLALKRRANEGGSYHVQASLTQSAMFLQRQGLEPDFSQAPERLSKEQLASADVEEDSPYGRLRSLGPVLRMSETQPHWVHPTVSLGADSPEWLPRQL